MSAFRSHALGASALIAGTIAIHAQSSDVSSLLARAGDRVQQYYNRAQSIICLDTIRQQPIQRDLLPDGPARVLEYELRITWEPRSDGLDPEANIVRRVLKINGRPPKPDEEPECTDPHSVTDEPLALLLPAHRADYNFKVAGSGRMRDRKATMIDYKPKAVGKAEVTWKKDCMSFSLPGRTMGRIWIDSETDDVLRLDESLNGWFEYSIPREHMHINNPPLVSIQRADSSIRYRRVTFSNPDETILLPESVDSLQIVQGVATPRLRTTETFKNYQRFVTEGRIVQ
jgi:hypothetical protein